MKQLKPLACLLLVFLAFLAAPVFGEGIVYVPYSTSFKLGDLEYRTWVWASNHNTEILGLAEHHLIPTFADGTADRDVLEPKQVWIGAGQSKIIKIAPGAGMLEILASPDVYIHARLVPVGEDPASGQGIELPVISSDNLVAANEEAHLLGFERQSDGDEAFSSFGLVNLGHGGTECTVSIFRGDGQAVIEDVALGFNPLSMNHFDNVLAIVGATEAGNWRTSVRCDQPFFPYLALFYVETGRVAFVEAAQSGKSQLSRPTEGGVSDQFDYLSDLPIDRWGGIELRPFVDASGINFHGGSGNTVLGGFAPIRINGTTYEKGISFYGKWSQTPFVEFKLDGKYALFTAVVRLDDYARGRYEWAIVQGGRWIRLERPSDGFRGRERGSYVRVGGSCTFQVKGDGATLLAGPVIYAHRAGVVVELDVTGVQTLRLQTHPDGVEALDAPYRNGLSRDTPVGRTPWWDLISFADAKLFYPK